MSLLILGTIAIGLLLGAVGVVWMVTSPERRWRGGVVILAALLLQSWWVVLAAMVLYKFVVLQQDT